MRSTLSCANGAEDPDAWSSVRTRVHEDDVRHAEVLDPVINDREEVVTTRAGEVARATSRPSGQP